MQLTVEIDPARRTAAFREVSYLAAGDSCRVVLDGVRGADFGSLALLLYRDAASESPVASCASFSRVPNHPSLADGALALDTAEMAAWFADAVPGESDDSDDALPRASAPAETRLASRASLAERSVRADGWLVVFDRDRTWAACRVPVLLRPGAGTSGASDPSSLRALVSDLVAGLVSAALSGKADKVPSAVSGNLASLDASGNLADSGATPASIKAAAVAEVVANAPGTMDTLKEIADILGSSQQSGTVLRRISDLESGKVDKESGKGLSSNDYADADKAKLAGIADGATAVSVDPALATRGAAADAKAVGDALRSGFTEWVCDRNDVVIKWYSETGTPGWAPYDKVSPTWQLGNVKGGESSTRLEWSQDEAMFPISAERRLITPTKTSQLTNDGDGTSAFAKVSQLPSVPGAYTGTPAADGAGSAGSSTAWARGDHVHPTDSTRAPLASPAFTGTPTAPTAAAHTNTTQIATTAFVEGEMPYDFIVAVQNGDWQFSGDGAQTGHVYDVVVTQYDDRYSYMLREDGEAISSADFDTAQTTVDFSDSIHADPIADITATRAYALHNRANNKVILADDSGTSYLQIPAATAGKMRDLLVRVVLEEGYMAATSPNNEFEFVVPTGETVTFESRGGAMPYPEEDGAYWFSLSESDQTVVGGVVTASKFAVAMEKMVEVE